MKGLLLAGGHGTRLRPLTYTGNKHLLPVANKPIIMYGLEALRNAGITEVGIILGPVREGVKELLGDGSEHDLKITYIDQPNPLGLAHAVMVAKPFLKDDPFVMYLGDNLLKMPIKPLADQFLKEKPAAFILLNPVRDPTHYGVAVLDPEGKVIQLVEKPKVPPSNLALVGVYIFTPQIHDVIKTLKPSWRGELEITDAIQGLINEGRLVKSQVVSGWWKDTGKPEDLLEANQLVLSDLLTSIKGQVASSADIQGPIVIGEGSSIGEGCRLRGPLIIGSKSTIGPNTYIGPYTTIGNQVVIEDAEIEYSIIMDHATIKCRARIVDSLIGRNANIQSSLSNRPSGHRLIVGDQSVITL